MLASTKHLFILSACLLPLLTQCGDGGKTTEELYTDKRPNDQVTVTPADIATLEQGDIITTQTRDGNTSTSLEVDVISATSATVTKKAITATTTPPNDTPPSSTKTTIFQNVTLTWTRTGNTYTLSLSKSAENGTEKLDENGIILFDLNNAERDHPQTGTKALVPGKIISSPNDSEPSCVLKSGLSVLLKIPLPPKQP